MLVKVEILNYPDNSRIREAVGKIIEDALYDELADEASFYGEEFADKPQVKVEVLDSEIG